MEYLDEILKALADEGRFIRLTLSGAPKSSEAPWLKVVLRPVQGASGRAIQALLQGEQKETARTLSEDEWRTQIGAYLDLGFRRIHLQCAHEDLHIRITRKGKVLASRGKPSAPALAGAPAHDRVKQHPLPADQPDPFLETAGIMRKGRVRARMQDKFRQINRFLELLDHTRLVRRPPDGPMHIVDCGCGQALLAFAARHYLRDKRGLDVRLAGVDANAEVIGTATALRDRLAYDNVQLAVTAIRDYEPPAPPHAVFSLHACDTATDEAIARGVGWGAVLILCVPCCQHELHHDIARPEFRAALRHGILRERMADVLTDALRAAALRVMGYRADVIEFISPEHTTKNLMIRAEKADGIPVREAVEEYRQLRDFWEVKPHLEQLIGPSFTERLSQDRDP